MNMLVGLRNNVDFTNPRHRVIFGAACLGFYFLLRRAEYLAFQHSRHRYAIEVGDVVVRNDKQPTLSIAEAVAVTVNFSSKQE